MKIKLGYSTGVFWNYDISLKEKVKLLLEIDQEAIEVMFNKPEALSQIPDSETLDLIKKFKYRSIHAPMKEVHYSQAKCEDLIDKLLLIAETIEAHTILFHPVNIEDHKWLGNKVGNIIAFENMDNRQHFGKTVKDLKSVYDKVPHAKWVFDVNHLYTHNPTLSKVNLYQKALGKRLCHYHFSGFGSFHDCISITKENVMFSGITDLTKPIISEGSDKKMKDVIKKEHKYILDYLSRDRSS